jgi:hypothetical protein
MIELVQDLQIIQNRVPAAIETLSPIPMDGPASGPIPVRKGQHLDVDEILRRSLPRPSQPKVLSRGNKVTP